MPNTKVIVIKSLEPYFIEGDSLTIVPILYDVDTPIRDEMWGWFRESDGTLFKIAEIRDMGYKTDGLKLKKMSDTLYAPKGSYKNSFIETQNGSRYPSSIVRRFETYFKKV